MKLDEIICLTAWKVAFEDGAIGEESNATEKEKNIVRSMRKFFKMDAERFNNAHKDFEGTKHLEDKDPITKIISIWASLKVAYAENEGSADGSNNSDIEWAYIMKINNATGINSATRKDISSLADGLVKEISAPEFLNDEDLLDIIDFEKECGEIFKRSVQPVLQAFFTSLEKNNLLESWKENYIALIKYKLELESMFGKMDLKEFDTRYKELKPTITLREKENKARAKQLAKEEAIEKKNKTHELSVAHGIKYCRYCGLDYKYSSDCRREIGHKFSVKRVLINKYMGPSGGYGYKPICSKCGSDYVSSTCS